MKKNNNGFGLIEILIAMFIVTFGVVAVGQLQLNLLFTSAENKSNSEALTIAQSRIEDYRNYANTSGLTSTNFASSTYFNYVTKVIPGDYANYKRSESYNFNGNEAEVVISVSWDDSKGNSQSVHLATLMTFMDDSSSVTGSYPIVDNFVDAPTGRAYIGKGEVSSKGLTDTEKYDVDSNDGTSRYNDKGDGASKERFLAVGDDIVLTLEEACVLTDGSDYNCTDFVEISGTVFLDSSFDQSGNASDIFVLASDAAFCARYTDSKQFEVVDSDGNKPVISISELPTLDFIDASISGKYAYFNYTCYIGGGWHGNIGIVGIEKDEQICVGDPSSTRNSVEESRRRAYRGMTWKFQTTGGVAVRADIINNDGVEDLQPIPYKSDDQAVIDRNLDDLVGTTRYYSWGIADASIIENTSTEHHDFLLIGKSGSCSSMSKSIFENNTDDFYCLNEIKSGANGLGYNSEVDEYSDTSVNKTNLDERLFDKDRDGEYENEYFYGFYDYCPYDPTNPPYFVHQATGQLIINGDSSGSFGSTIMNGMVISTTQGNNCSFDNSFLFTEGADSTSSFYTAAYTCDLFDTGDISPSGKLTAVGFTGSIDVEDNDATDLVEIDCSGDANGGSYSLSASMGETNVDFNCSVTVMANTLYSEDDSYDFFTSDFDSAVYLNIFDNDTWPSDVTSINLEWLDSSGSPTGESQTFTTSLIGSGNYLEYTQSQDGSYSESLFYRISASGYDSTAPTRITIGVVDRSSNSSPSAKVAPSLSYVAYESTPLSIAVADLLANITGGDGVLSISSAESSKGSIIIGAAGITFTSNLVDTYDEADINYTVIDEDGDTADVSVTIPLLDKATIKIDNEILSGNPSLTITPDTNVSESFTSSGGDYLIYVDQDGWSGAFDFESSKTICSVGGNSVKASTYNYSLNGQTNDLTISVVSANKSSDCP